MKLPYLLIIPGIFFLFSSCKKEALEGNTAILIGKWQWTETWRVTDHCLAASSWVYTLEDSSEMANSYELEFFEKGKVKFLHNGGTVFNQRIVFSQIIDLPSGPWDYQFIINLNNNSNDQMELWVAQDSLLIHDYPYDTEESCQELYNYFKKG